MEMQLSLENKVAIVTDSIGCIPEELIKRYGIYEVPLKIVFENRTYRDRVDLKADEFYQMLKNSNKPPTTAAPSPGHFLDVYREINKETPKILCITLSSKLSGTFNAAKIAANMAKEALPNIMIEVLDSRNAAAAEGLIVLAAARAAAAGKRMDEVINAARNVIGNVHLFAVVDTLEYLIKGGRVPKLVGWAGTLLNIKPILKLENGEAHPAARARSYPNAVKQIIAMIKKSINNELPLHMIVMHAAEPARAEELKNRIDSLFDCSEIMITDFTPVMGAHTGPGLVGVAFYNG